jgi:HD superfamily phosphohydrolase
MKEKYPEIDFGENIYHENRSIELLKLIINDIEVLRENITLEEIKFICNLINPDKKLHNGYIYQIVSNNLNGLDVDKYDYLTRDSKMLGINISFQSDRLINNAKVIDNTIIYCKQLVPDIINLFDTRHYMHRTIYGHKGVISIDYMLCELMLKLDKYLNFTELFLDLTKFVEFTDYDVLVQAKIFKHDLEIKKILDQIQNHQLFPMIFTQTEEKMDKFYKIDEFIKEEFLGEKDNFILHQSVIGYISGNKKNPLHNINVYSTKDDSIVKLLDSNLTKLMPENFQETILMIFYKDKNIDIKEIKSKLK